MKNTKHTRQSNPKQSPKAQPSPVADDETLHGEDGYVRQHARGEISFDELIAATLSDEKIEREFKEAVAQLASWICSIVAVEFPAHGTQSEMREILNSSLDKFRDDPEARKRWREGSKRLDAMMKEEAGAESQLTTEAVL